MSATLDADRFATYWGTKTPRLHIPGRTFPVVDFMLEDVLELTGYIPPKKGKKKSFSGSGYPTQGNLLLGKIRSDSKMKARMKKPRSLKA
jgi:HrpA-like RNA helicase